jgi:hypothetical protein
MAHGRLRWSNRQRSGRPLARVTCRKGRGGQGGCVGWLTGGGDQGGWPESGWWRTNTIDGSVFQRCWRSGDGETSRRTGGGPSSCRRGAPGSVRVPLRLTNAARWSFNDGDPWCRRTDCDSVHVGLSAGGGGARWGKARAHDMAHDRLHGLGQRGFIGARSPRVAWRARLWEAAAASCCS